MQTINMKLYELFSTASAAGYLQMLIQTFKREIDSGKIIPIAFGSRKYHGRIVPHGFVFTRRMLLDYNRSGRAGPTAEERAQIFNTASAAEFLGISVDAIKQAHHFRGILPGKRIGSNVVFLLEDLETYKARKRARGPDHPLAKFTADQVRMIRDLSRSGMSVREIAQRIETQADLTTIHGVIAGRTYKNV